MHLHVGENQIVPSKDIIIILNSKCISPPIVSGVAKKLENMVVPLQTVEVKSLVITKSRIYFSALAPKTLERRARFC